MKVAVGMSGGVDSSVAAYLLKKKGYEVVGLFMKNWDDSDDEFCPAAQDYEDALAVAEHLGIPLYSFNFAKEYWDNVFQDFIDDLEKGFTPNPDILCNREIKFKVFLEKALELGADFLATGHYARIGPNHELLRGKDLSKDQSYFLHALSSSVLQKVLFPIGEYHKEEIRKIAEKASLLTANKRDSTGICFIGKRKFKDFIKEYIKPSKGLFKTPEGEIVGEHDGAWYYTIGQRKGLGIGGEGDAWFVVNKDIESQTVTVVQGENHSLLFTPNLYVSDLNWINSQPSLPLKCTAKIRYRQNDVSCTIKKITNGRGFVEFEQAQRAVTPHQSIVFYQNDICLGGGLINLF